jgi:hypothetical protein
MKLKKVCVTVMATVLLIGGATTNLTYAAELQESGVDYQIVTPFWDEISSISPYISADGTTLYPEVYIKAKSSSDPISGTMYLEKYSSGKWISVTSWSISETGDAFLSKSYKGSSGYKYRTKVIVNVDGENAVATSGTCEI